MGGWILLANSAAGFAAACIVQTQRSHACHRSCTHTGRCQCSAAETELSGFDCLSANVLTAVACASVPPRQLLAAAVVAGTVAALVFLLVTRRRRAYNTPAAYACSSGLKDPEARVAAAAAGSKGDGAAGSLASTSPHDSSTAGTK
jgi:hypothetical protein